MPTKAEQKERTHEAILEAAGRSLRRRGISGSTVADVMKAAGLTVGGFYAHFRSKDELLAAAMRQTGRQMWARVLAASAGRPGEARALAAVDAYLSERHRDDPDEGCLLPATAAEVAREGEPYRAVLRASIDGLATELGALLGGGAAGRARALGLVALMVGGLSLARALGRSEASREVLAAARAAARMVVKGG
jgi:TetR/AcrR family transcriptional repressor of nem operon